jgi:drug/metabolite transporter (DMT)-like permease
MADPVSKHDREELQRRGRVKGIALMCAANVCFATADTTGKFLVQHMSSVQVTWARFIGAFLVSLIICNIVLGVLFVSNLSVFFALRFLQLDQMASILFAAPFIVAALSVPLLGEWVGPRRWAAIIVGFIGVLIVIRPGFGGIHPAAFICLGCAFLVAVYSIMTRVLSHSDSSATTMFYTNIMGAVVLTALLPLFWSAPSQIDTILMASLGAIATCGHYFLIAAHRLAPASVLAPFMYTQLVWMIFYGYTVFNQLPNQWTLAGASVVIASGLYLLYREVKVKGERAPVSADPVA